PVSRGDVMDKKWLRARHFESLSIRDLLDAREAYHVHLAHLDNVFATDPELISTLFSKRPYLLNSFQASTTCNQDRENSAGCAAAFLAATWSRKLSLLF